MEQCTYNTYTQSPTKPRQNTYFNTDKYYPLTGLKSHRVDTGADRARTHATTGSINLYDHGHQSHGAAAADTPVVTLKHDSTTTPTVTPVATLHSHRPITPSNCTQHALQCPSNCPQPALQCPSNCNQHALQLLSCHANCHSSCTLALLLRQLSLQLQRSTVFTRSLTPSNCPQPALRCPSNCNQHALQLFSCRPTVTPVATLNSYQLPCQPSLQLYSVTVTVTATASVRNCTSKVPSHLHT
jgi:hypothetical protein